MAMDYNFLPVKFCQARIINATSRHVSVCYLISLFYFGPKKVLLLTEIMYLMENMMRFIYFRFKSPPFDFFLNGMGPCLHVICIVVVTPQLNIGVVFCKKGVRNTSV